jgi:putative ABC transport system substrate-binding protein
MNQVQRRQFLVASGALLAAPLLSFAQQNPPKIARIGFLGSESTSTYASRIEALRTGLRDLGYVEGKNIAIEFRWAEGNLDRLTELATELVRLKVDVIVTHSTPAISAAKQVTTSTPIVMATSADALATGLVANLARPGGNVTGSTAFGRELSAKRLELIKEAMPRLTQVAVVFNSGNPSGRTMIQAIEITAKPLKIALQPFGVRGPDEFAGAFAAMAKKRVGAFVTVEDPMLNVNASTIADLAIRHRLTSSGSKEIAEAGGLIGYGVNSLELYRRAAYFVDKILKGAKPGDLPIEGPTTFDLVVNTRTAKTLGIRIPQSILIRASQVIE